MATAPIRVEVVNAFVSSLMTLLRSCGENDAKVGPLRLVTQVPAAPSIAVSVEISGSLAGPVMWTFDPEVAKVLIQRLFSLDPNEDSEISTADAVSELSNIVVGNATDKLLAAGYQVELRTPTVVFNENPENCHLPDGAIRVAVQMPTGQVNMLLSLNAGRPM
jgi:CheY-specific phosphatase CheX